MNIDILNWPGPPWEVDWGEVKRAGRSESIGAVIHIGMGTTQRYLYLQLAKRHVSCFIFYVFSSTK
jgi:hypothetical protein